MNDSFNSPLFVMLDVFQQKKHRKVLFDEVEKVLGKLDRERCTFSYDPDNCKPSLDGDHWIRVSVPWIIHNPRLGQIVRHRLAINALTK